jgi:hypothetical protein
MTNESLSTFRRGERLSLLCLLLIGTLRLVGALLSLMGEGSRRSELLIETSLFCRGRCKLCMLPERPLLLDGLMRVLGVGRRP